MAIVNLYMHLVTNKFLLYLLLTVHITTQKLVDFQSTSFIHKWF